MTYWFPLGFRVLVAVAEYVDLPFSSVWLEITLIGFGVLFTPVWGLAPSFMILLVPPSGGGGGWWSFLVSACFLLYISASAIFSDQKNILCGVGVGEGFTLLVCLPRGLGGGCHFFVQVHLLVLGVGLWGIPCLGVLFLGLALLDFTDQRGFDPQLSSHGLQAIGLR